MLGTVIAGYLEDDTLRHLGTVPMLSVGLIKEATKLLVPPTVLVFTRHQTTADGLVVGVTAEWASRYWRPWATAS